MDDAEQIDSIDALLPQTQCRKCGFDGCRPYAVAIAARLVPINRCPPGGAATIAALARLVEAPWLDARLLDSRSLILDPEFGREAPRQIARIDEALCIGCTLCIQACPVDAIVGAARLMHTVIAPLCTGCDLCLAPCPVDCITMIDPPAAALQWSAAEAAAARRRFDARNARTSHTLPNADDEHEEHDAHDAHDAHLTQFASIEPPTCSDLGVDAIMEDAPVAHPRIASDRAVESLIARRVEIAAAVARVRDKQQLRDKLATSPRR